MSNLKQNRYDDSVVKIESLNEPHLACVLLLDTSGSMAGEPIDSLNKAINRFKQEIAMDELAQKRVDIAIVEFNTDVRVVQPFTPICRMEPIQLEATGCTSMARGIETAIDLVKERNRFYDSMGTPCFRPWIFMITDGYSTEDMENAIARVKLEESKGTHGKLKFFTLGVSGYDKDTMFRLTNRVMELKETNFTNIFNWLSESMVTISVSRVGAEAPLPMLPEDARKADPDRDLSDWD